MNIWYLHHYATPYEIAGLHRPFEFGAYFKKENNDITVFSSSYLHYEDRNIIKDNDAFVEKIYDGIKTVYVKTCGYSKSGIARVVNMWQFFWGMMCIYKKITKNGNIPDIIVASSPHPLTMLAGIKIAKKLGIPCVCEVRDLWPEVFFYGGRVKEKSIVGKLLLWGEKYLYEKSTAIVFLKEGDYTYIVDHKWDSKNGGKINLGKCYYVNNGVDISLFDKRKEECVFQDDDLENKKFKVVYCGTIRPVNKVDILLDVAKILGNKVDILIYGMGSCLEDLEQRVKNEKIINVKLKGYVENKYIPYILSKSDVNILNYSGTAYNWTRGNSSNKLFEYLASERPVVSTVKMGYDILERYQCGFSADMCTPEKIAACIEKTMSQTESEYIKMCRNAREAAENFDIPVLAKKYLNLLIEIKGDNSND